MKSSVPKKLYRKVRKTLLVDSRDRNTTQTQSRYTVTLPKVYENVYSVTLRSAEIPVSWYTFSAALGNTSFTVTHNTTKTITIPDGNYDSTSFITAMLAALNATTSGFGAGAFTLTYDATTMKFTFGTPATVFSFSFPNALPRSAFWGLGYYMGFFNASHTSSSTPFTLTSDFAIQLSSNNYVIMELDFINKEDETSVDSRLSGNVDGCFAKIPISANPGAIVIFREVGIPMNRSILSPPISQLKSLNIKFRDHYGNLIDFNNIDHSLTLEFELLDNNFDEYSSLDFSSLA